MAQVNYGHKENGKIVKDGHFDLPDFEPTAETTLGDLAKVYGRKYDFTEIDGEVSVVDYSVNFRDMALAVRQSITIDLQGKGRPAKASVAPIKNPDSVMGSALGKGEIGKAIAIAKRYPNAVSARLVRMFTANDVDILAELDK